MALSAKTLDKNEYFFGHAACGGCPAALAVRMALKVCGPSSISALPAGCMSAVGFNFPQMGFSTNAAITPFAASAAVACGIEAGLRAQNKKPDDCTVLAISGDGGTADIGMASLSGMLDRGDDVLYICYDNEAYMNTGIQESSLTPYGAATTTSPAGTKNFGTLTEKKQLFEIVAAHKPAYAATASVGYLNDFIHKLEIAKNTKGSRFIHVLAPCPTGWGHKVELGVELAKEAVDCGLWYLAQYDRQADKIKLNRKPKDLKDPHEYLKAQKRFKHLSEQDIEHIIAMRNECWEYMNKYWV